ncbi:MAG: hypothetical protein NTY80_02530 [candidate division SR1 bacterium]|nr:hypothetical protein [candidate division SR1 bacterium]
MNIRKITRTLFHPTTIKIVSMIFIVGFFFILPTYAQSTGTGSLSEVQKLLNSLLSLCSRGWIILAVLAGKLMTNDWVYGSIIHMDIYLWKIRNIMKNFANFGLVAIVLRNIIQNLIGKEKINIKDIITKTLIAGILIQASWFLVAAVVDVSTIATTAIGAFTTSFLQSSPNLQTQINNSITNNVYTKYIIDLSGGNAITPIVGDKVSSPSRESILPTYNSVSGPLIYLGFSVFKFQNYMNVQGSPGAESLTISFLLRVVLILFYTLGLALLFIANIIRVAFLRIFIIAAPLLVLAQVFKSKALESGGGVGKYLKFSVMLDLIFKPLIFVAGFSMILILVVSIQSIMNGTLPKDFNGVTIGVNSSGSSLAIEGISTINIQENNILGSDPFSTAGAQITETGQTIFVNLLLFFLTTFLMRQFIKMAVTSGKGSPISDIMTPMVNWVEKAAKTVPVLPMGGGMSVGAMQNFSAGQKNKLAEGFGMNTSGQFTESEQKFDQFVSAKMGIQQSWGAKDYQELNKFTGFGGNFINESAQIAEQRVGGLYLGDSSRRPLLERWLKNNPTASGITRNDTFENTFKNNDNPNAKNNRVKLHNLMGGDGSVAPGGVKLGNNTDISYDTLSNNVYHKTNK